VFGESFDDIAESVEFSFSAACVSSQESCKPFIGLTAAAPASAR